MGKKIQSIGKSFRRLNAQTRNARAIRINKKEEMSFWRLATTTLESSNQTAAAVVVVGVADAYKPRAVKQLHIKTRLTWR